MERALLLAQRGSGHVSPNPLVGAVLVHDGRIIGEGWHAAWGQKHAEVVCFESVAPADKSLIPESTLYVTLEPCAHQGKQPPCAHRIVQEGVRRVIVAMEDPYPQVQGRGIGILREAGVEVETGVCEAEARWLCRRFLAAQEGKRPYVILKWAETRDGFFAPADRSRMQLSNAFSQTLAHQWRSRESAILVGYRTALADNPQLNPRAWQGPAPLRIALDRNLHLPLTHHLLDGSTPTWIINEQHESNEGAVRFVRLAFDENLLPALLALLLPEGRHSLFVEGGATVHQHFIDAGLWDEARLFRTPQMLGTGLPAPQLREAVCRFTTDLSGDELSIFQPANSSFIYPKNALL